MAAATRMGRMKRFFLLLLVSGAWGAEPAETPATFEISAPLRLQAGGYLRMDYSAQKGSADSFKAKFARLRFVGSHPELPGWRLVLMHDFADASGLRDAYLEYAAPPLARERVRLSAALGQLKPPFGRAHLRYPPEFELLELPVAVRGLNPGRDIGTSGWDLGALGQARFDAVGRKDLAVLQFGAFNGEGANTADKNSQKNALTRLVLNPAQEFSAGGSWAQGSTGTASAFYQRFGWDAEVKLGPAAFSYEQLFGRTGSIRAKGEYWLASVWLLPRKLRAAASFGRYDPNLGRDGDRTRQTTLSVNVFPHRFVRVAAEFTFIREEAAQVPNDLLQLAVICQF